MYNGGEEFAVILHGTDKAGMLIAVEKLRKAVESHEIPYGYKQPQGRLTISIGGATYPDDAVVAKELIEFADKALYHAKRMGKNRVFTF